MRIPADAVGDFLEAGRSGGPQDNMTDGEAPDRAHERFLVAVELAREGRYQEAEQLLPGVVRDEEALRPAVLHLQARIYAQQGRYREAEVCWLEAVRLAPGNPRYHQALKALRDGVRPWPAVRLAAGGLIVLAVAIVGFALLAGRFEDLAGRQEHVLGKVDEVGRDLQDAQVRQEAALDDVERRLLETDQGLAEDVGALAQRLDALAQQLDGITRKLSSDIKAEAARQKQAAEQMLQRVDALKTDAEQRERTLAKSLTETGRQLSEADKGISGQLAELENRVRKELADQKKTLSAAAAMTEALSGELSKLENRIQAQLKAQEQPIAELRAAVAALSEESSKAEERRAAALREQQKLIELLIQKLSTPAEPDEEPPSAPDEQPAPQEESEHDAPARE